MGDTVIPKNITYEFGNVNVTEFLQKLAQEGICDAKVDGIGNSVMIHLVSNI